MIFKQIAISPMQNFAYLIGDEKEGVCAVVDPSDAGKVLGIAAGLGLNIIYIINTHGHIDHTSGNREVKGQTGAKVIAHTSSRIEKDVGVDDGDIIEVGALRIEVIHTPGHTPDGICLLVEKKLMTGDTLFVGECGRTDLPGSDSRSMYDSLFNKLMKLEDDIEVYPGHDYGKKPSSTIGDERRTNYTLEPRSVDEFVRFMAEP
jgi:glyoxylase-like metal-dependent hydrolase (beta-lactamase superfamily II)